MKTAKNIDTILQVLRKTEEKEKACLCGIGCRLQEGNQLICFSKKTVSWIGENMKNGICYIVGAGENYGLDFHPTAEDYVIAADAGLRYLEQAGIRADLAIGDFDSLKAMPQRCKVMTLSTEKDDTDMLAAVREGIKAGYSRFHLYCGTGGRIDHTLANLQVLSFLAENGKQGFLIDQNSMMTAITNGTLSFASIASGYVSVFSDSPKATGVCLHGLKYELDHAVLSNTFPLGVSNEFIGKESSISVDTGTLLIVFPRNNMESIL